MSSFPGDHYNDIETFKLNSLANVGNIYLLSLASLKPTAVSSNAEFSSCHVSSKKKGKWWEEANVIPSLLFVFLLILPLNGIALFWLIILEIFSASAPSVKQEWFQPNNKTDTEKKRSNCKAHRFNLDFNLDKILIISSDMGLHDPQSWAKCKNNYGGPKQTDSTDFQRGLKLQYCYSLFHGIAVKTSPADKGMCYEWPERSLFCHT